MSGSEVTCGQFSSAPTTGMVDDAAKQAKDTMLRLSQFRSALMRGNKLLARNEPEKAKLFKRGLGLVERSLKLKSSKALSILFTFAFFLGAFSPVLMAGDQSVISSDSKGTILVGAEAPAGAPDDFTLGSLSSNLTTSTTSTSITVWTEEYSILVDYSTSFVDYKIRPYFCSDFIRYRRSNPQYSGDGVTDSDGNALDGSISMTISRWGKTGNTIWFLESCPEFSINQTFRIFKDYFELDATYKPGTKKVIATYFFGIYSSSNSIYSMVSSANNRYNRYLPGYDEATPEGYGLGGWYPSFKMYAPACDLRANGKNIGVEWGYNETVAYLHSPLWMKDCDTGGASVMALKYSSMNSVVPNVGLGTQKTFHMFVRPYKYTDGKPRGYDVGYAQWVAPKIASAWGNHNTPIFPLAVMDLSTWSDAFRSWVENSQVKVATYSNNPDQVNWNYKSSQSSNTDPGTPSTVPTAWQLYISSGTPMLTSDGKAICSAASGPATQSNTYRWQLINNDGYMSWWTGTTGVFWDEINMWTAENRLRSDYQNRPDFVYDGVLKLVKESYASGYWSYVITNPFTALLHLSIASDVTLIEGYEATSVYGTDLKAHVISTMDFVNNIPVTYRPHILVYQNYNTGSASDQEKVYSALLGSAKYKFDIELLSFNSYSYQMHNYQMAEDMFKAMGCTRNDCTRIPVDTLDLSQSLTLTTSAGMVVMMGSGRPTISETASLDTFKITNLHATSNTFDLRIPGSGYYLAGPGAQSVAAMTYSVDGYAKFSGSVDAEKTATISRNTDINVIQRTSGTATVSLSSTGPTADLTVSATGGTTDITLKGFAAGRSYDILVNGAVADHKTAASDGSLSFSRTYGSGDRVTTQESSQSDTSVPFVTSCIPANGAANVAVGTQITLTFNESMDQSSVQSSFSLMAGTTVQGTFSWQDGSKTLKFTPSSALPFSAACTVTLGTGAKDLAGNKLASGYASSFTTEARPNPPSAPSGLAASASAQRANLSWTAPSNNGGSAITNYKIYRGTSPNGEATSPIATIGNLTSYSDSGLSNGATYYYKVSAINSAGEGNRSNEAMATTPNVPSAPGSLSAVPGIRSSTLSWSAPSNNGGSPITGYKIYRGTVSGSVSWLATLGVATSFTDTGLTNGTTYYYQVSAVNGVGEGARTNEIHITTTILPPTAPTTLLTAGGYRKVTLTWVAPSSNGGAAINGYNIYRGTASGSLSLLTNVGNVLTYTDSNLANGTRYYYQVTATNVAGESARSNERWGTPSTVAPEAPTNPVANGGYRSVVLTWNAPSSDGGSPVTGYKVFRGISSGSLTNIANLGNSLSYTDQNLANGTRYYYQVSAVNGMGEGARTVELSAMTSVVVPTQPMGLAAIAVGGGNISLTWSAPASEGGSAVTDYRIYRGTSSGSETFLASVGTQRSYLDSGLGYGQTLFYQVSATNAAGEGGRSSEASASISSSLPSSPQNLVAFSGDSTVGLSWSAPNRDGGTPITGFRIYRGPIVGEESLLGSCVGLSYEDTTAMNGQTYFYKVSAVNSVGEGDCSNEASAMPFGLPHAPIDLEARASNGGASLTWAPPSDNGGRQITSYKIYRGDSPSSTVLLTSTGTGQEYQDSGLVNGEVYYYEVSAVSEIGEGARSQCASVTPGFVPTQPLNLVAMAGNARVSLTWSPPLQDNGYTISSYSLYRAGADGAFSLLAGLGVTSSYVDNDVVNGEPYRYRVSAGNVFGEGAFSTECTATPMTAPSAPTEFTASGSTGQISLSWKMPLSDGGSKVSGFILLRGSQPATMVQLAQLGAVTSYVDRSLPKGTTYHYALRALNAAGSSDSAMASATTFDVPGAPQGVTVTNGLNAVVVQWSAPAVGGGSPISGYRIFRGGSPSDLSGLAYLSNGSSYSDSGLSPGITYYYAVAALNMVGEGDKSVPCSATTTVLPPSEPIAVTVKVSGNGLSVSWSAPVTDGGSPIIKYRVYRAAGDAPMSACADCIGLEYNDSAVGYGILYRYVIKALNAQGEGQPSLEAKGIVADAPDAVSGLQAVKGNGSVTLAWTVPDDGGSAITSYTIYRGLTLGTEVKIDTVSAKSTYVDSFPPKGQGAYYRVAAVNDVSEGAMSSAVFVSLLKKPNVVRDLRAEVSDGVVQLTWQPPVDDGGDAISGYAVYQAANTGNWQYLISVQTTHFKVEGLENGRTYRFSVAAINSMGQSESNSTIEAVPLGAPDAPGALTAVPYNGLVTLRWEAPAQNGGSPITGYRIYISQNGTYALVAAPDADAISFVCTGLLNGQDYLFSVSAVNGAGEGNRSLPSAATPFSGKAADVGGGSPSGSLVGGGMTTVMLAVTLSAAMIIILGFWSTTRNGRKNANGQTNKEEQTEMKEEKATQTSKPEAAAKPVGQPKGVKVDSAFEDSLRELEELESQL